MHRWYRIMLVVVIASLAFSMAGCTVGSRRIVDDTVRLDSFDAVVFELVAVFTALGPAAFVQVLLCDIQQMGHETAVFFNHRVRMS